MEFGLYPYRGERKTLHLREGCKLSFTLPFCIGSVSLINLFKVKYTGQNLVKGLITCNTPTAIGNVKKVYIPSLNG